MRKLFLVIGLLFVLLNLSAQYFQSGQDPASIKWRQINTNNFQLIYPDYYELQAQKLALVMEKVYHYKSNSIQHKPQKISIILHTQTVQSNGLVAWAPKRSEFYTTPHQAIYPQDWLQQLAIHEFRHVVQIDKINTEIPKIIKILLGEQGTASVFGLYLPWWFIEGDAVVTETALGNFGRGRFPSFLMEHKAQVVEKGVYKYDKAYNGSSKIFVPDHYKLGYYLVGATRKKYGVEVWDSVLQRVGEKPFSLNPFNKELKLQTGLNKVQLYNSVFANYKNIWNEEDLNYRSIDFNQISKTNKSYTNYKYNHWLNDSILVAYKTSLSTIPTFVIIDKAGKEKKLFHPGRIFDESINYRDEWVVWSEKKSDLRWSHSGKSVLRLYNITNSKKYSINPDFKAFAPSVSPDKNKIIVVETDFLSNNYLSVYSIPDGQLLRRIQTKNNNYFFSPEWINEKEIVAVVLHNEGKRLARFDLDSGSMDFISEINLGEIKHLEVHKEKVYFVCGFQGKDALYSIDLLSNAIFQIYEPRFGAASPSVSADGKSLAFSDYTADGFRILEITDFENSKTPINKNHKYSFQLADDLAKQESGIINFSEIDTSKFESKKYSKILNMFNFHSWAPLSIDVNSYDISPGVSFMSQNKLGTAFTTLGYEWDVAEKTGKIYGKYTFKGWYPIFDVEVSAGNRASQYYLIKQNNIGDDTTIQRFTWKQINLELNARIPFNFSSGKYSRLLQPEIGLDYSHYKNDESTPDEFFEGNFQTLNYRLYYQQFMRQSFQDVYPNFGFISDVGFYHSPLGEINLGKMVIGQSYLFLPGFVSNHGIRFYAGFHLKEPEGSRSFPDAIKYPRGWGKINSTEMQSYGFDYKLPLLYPELSVGGLVYVKRVTTSLFADYAELKGNYYEGGNSIGTYKSNISSFGIEMMGDMHFLRFYAPVEIGFRTSYLPEMKNIYFDFLLSIDFNSL